MSDLTAILVFVACLLATLGLVNVCRWLGPRGRNSAAPSHPSNDPPPRERTP